MRSRDERDQRTLDIVAGLGLFAGVVLGGFLLVYLAGRVGLHAVDDATAPIFVGLVLVGVAVVVARFATRRR